MKFLKIILLMTFLLGLINSQCPNKAASLSSFNSPTFAGTWFVYQRSYTDDTNDYNRNGLCDNIGMTADSTSVNLNYTVFSLKHQMFKSNTSRYTYNDANLPGVWTQVINPAGTTDDQTLYGDPVFNVVATDYTSYALVWYCQTLLYNTDLKQYIMLLLRSLNNIESTVLPKIYDIFQKINNLNGYDGDRLELTYHDFGICRGL